MLGGRIQSMLMVGAMFVGGVAHADRILVPSGPQIAALAKGVRFDAGKTFSPRAGVRVTPSVGGVLPAANGRVVARVDIATSILRNLAVGRYHVYAARIGGTWRTLLERGGRVAAQQSMRVVSGKGSQFRSGMCFGWYECHNGQCVCYGIVIKGTPF